LKEINATNVGMAISTSPNVKIVTVTYTEWWMYHATKLENVSVSPITLDSNVMNVCQDITILKTNATIASVLSKVPKVLLVTRLANVLVRKIMRVLNATNVKTDSTNLKRVASPVDATQRVVKITNVMKMENVIANVMLLVINVMIAVQNFGISLHAKSVHVIHMDPLLNIMTITFSVNLRADNVNARLDMVAELVMSVKQENLVFPTAKLAPAMLRDLRVPNVTVLENANAYQKLLKEIIATSAKCTIIISQNVYPVNVTRKVPKQNPAMKPLENVHVREKTLLAKNATNVPPDIPWEDSPNVLKSTGLRSKSLMPWILVEKDSRM